MKRWGWLIAGWAGACAPPPAPAGVAEGPSIQILYPPDGTDEIEVGLLGRLSFLVVVDINDFLFVPAYIKEQDVEGEGHWHLEIDGAMVAAAEELWLEYESEPNVFEPGELVLVKAVLVQNTHAPVEGVDPATVEFNVAGIR